MLRAQRCELIKCNSESAMKPVVDDSWSKIVIEEYAEERRHGKLQVLRK